MPANKNTKQQLCDNNSKRLPGQKAAEVRQSAKGKGTRTGSLDDWRVGGAKGSVENLGVGKRLRDGR
jgi:hypothetical protein